MRATFVSLKYENNARTIASFVFKPASTYRYEAGQYAVITVPHASPDSRGTSRTMTLSSSPSEDLLKITMRLFAEGGSSFKQALLNLHVGDEVTIYDSMGDLVLPLDTSIPLVFVAGGVGIASFVGMTKWLHDHHDQRALTLHYAVGHTDDIVLQQPFDDYAKLFPLAKVLYTSSPSTPGGFEGAVRHSRLTSADITPTLSENSLVYISGTEHMVEDIRGQLLANGVSRQQIIFDYFEGYSSGL